jgi:hypothetical protein
MSKTFTYNSTCDPKDVYGGGLNIFVPAGDYQLNDPAIYYAFRDFWNTHLPNTPWFLGLSFINPHDIANFPWAFGLATNANGQPCGPTQNFNCVVGYNQGFYPPPLLGWSDISYNTGETIQFNGIAPTNIYNTTHGAPSDWNQPDDPIAKPYDGGTGKPGVQAFYESNQNQRSGSINT